VSTAAGQLAGKAPVVTGGYALVMDVNVDGTFRLAKDGVPALARAPRGTIVMTVPELGLATHFMQACQSRTRGE